MQIPFFSTKSISKLISHKITLVFSRRVETDEAAQHANVAELIEMLQPGNE